MLRLPRLISSGCVLQQGEKTRIFGFANPGGTVTVRLQECSASGTAGEDGRFDVYLGPLRPGGPFVLTVETSFGECLSLEDVYVGEVWLGSGQSNMELPVARVRDRYPGVVENSENPQIHLFQISECCEFGEPLEDCRSGEWKTAGPKTVENFSALCLFFAQFLQAHANVPVGIICASLGGSPAEAWMSKEALANEPQALAEAARWMDSERIRNQQETDAAAIEAWQATLRSRDRGFFDGDFFGKTGFQWEQDGFPVHADKAAGNVDSGVKNGESVDICRKNGEHVDEKENLGWKEISMPGYLSDAGLEHFIGSVWLRRRFTLPSNMEKMEGTEAALWLGTMTDSDDAWVNGVPVGQTGYQYPPRKYRIPAGVLQKGENTLVVRLVSNNGHGRFTPGPGKEYRIFNEQGSVELGGRWEYRVGGRMEEPAPEQTFISWTPTGLYNGMLHPCQSYTVRGILWYQGESNDKRPDSYERILKTLIHSWRNEWGQERLPFLAVQLPGFEIDLPENGSWPSIRQAQQKAAGLPDTATVVTLDLGEKNDLHPTGKKEIAQRLFQAARRMVYGEPVPCQGPVPEKAEFVGETTVKLTFRLDEMETERTLATLDGQAPGEFEVAGADGVYHPAKAALDGLAAEIICPEAVDPPVRVRYAWRNAPDRGLLVSPSGILASPFEMEIT